MKLIALIAFAMTLTSQAQASSLHIDGNEASALMNAVADAGSPVSCKVEPCGNKIAAIACEENDPHGLSCIANLQKRERHHEPTSMAGSSRRAQLDRRDRNEFEGCGCYAHVR